MAPARTLLLVVLAGMLAVPPAASAQRRAGPTGAPNVLIVMTDDQRFDSMAMLPRTRAWFGDQGTYFPNSYANTPLCCPSRASIMTGRYTHNHDVRNNQSAEALDQRTTLQWYLQQAGYLTAISGKYLNDWNLDVPPPSFHRWSIMNFGYTKKAFNVDGKVSKVKRYSTDFIRAKALEYLSWFEGEDARPWYLMLTPFAPHEPFTPAKRHRKAKVPKWTPGPAFNEADRSDKPPLVQRAGASQKGTAKVRRDQLRSLKAVDDLVDRVMTEIARRGEGNGTIAIFLSDNGFLLGEHGLNDKRWPYTPAAKIPMYVRWPGRVAAGATDPRLASTVDVVPTVLQATGVAADEETYPIDGRSLLGGTPPERVFLEHFVDAITEIPQWSSILTTEWQYVEYYDPESGSEAVTFREYYDLTSDPHQLQNLLADGDDSQPPPERVSALSSTLRSDRRCEGTSGPGACP